MSIRVRLATAFTLAAALLFALGAWLFVMALSSGLLNLLDAQLKADLTQAGRLVGSPKAGVATLAIPGQVNIQVFDAAGHLHGSWPDSSDVPLLTSAQLREARVSSLSVTVRLEDETQRLVAEPWSRPGWVVVAATSLATVDRALSDVEVGLVIAGVAVLVVAAFGSYALGRAALSPVERLRREVAALFQRGAGLWSRFPGRTTRSRRWPRR